LNGTDGPASTIDGLPREFVQVFGIEAQFFEDLVDAGGALFVVVPRDGHRNILRRFRLRKRDAKRPMATPGCSARGAGGQKGMSESDGNAHGPVYFSKTLVPRIFWLLSVPRKSGTMRSINSKYEDNAGVSCCALYKISSRRDSE